MLSLTVFAVAASAATQSAPATAATGVPPVRGRREHVVMSAEPARPAEQREGERGQLWL
jgi:hypothetical protein